MPTPSRISWLILVWLGSTLNLSGQAINGPPAGIAQNHEKSLNCPSGTTVKKIEFTGAIELKCETAEGIPEGPAICISKIRPGSITCMGKNSNGKMTGAWTFFDDKTGRIIAESTYSEGELDGLDRSWFASGSRQSEGHWRSGNRVGQWLFWWPNGQLQSVVSYRDNILDGTASFWDSSGKKREVRHIANGKLKAIQYWGEDGKELPEDVLPLGCRVDLGSEECPWRAIKTMQERIIHPQQEGVHGVTSITRYPLNGDTYAIKETVVDLLQKARKVIAFGAATDYAAVVVTSPMPRPDNAQEHYQFHLSVSGCNEQACLVVIRANKIIVPITYNKRSYAQLRMEEDSLTQEMIHVVERYLAKFREDGLLRIPIK